MPVKGIHEIHDTAVTRVHEMIRLVNRVAGGTIDAALNATLDGTKEATAETGRAPVSAAPDEPLVSPADKTP